MKVHFFIVIVIIASMVQGQVNQEKNLTLSKEFDLKGESIIGVHQITDLPNRHKLINDIKPGFYIITNAFKNMNYKNAWVEKLKQYGFEPQSFLWPQNGLEYVYIAYDENDFMLRDMLIAARQIPELKDAWIKEIE